MESHIKKAGVLVGQVDTKLDAGRLAGMKRMADFSDRGLAKKMFRNNVVENEPAADVSAGDGAINIHISGQAPVFNPYPRKPKKKLDEELDEERRWSGIYDILFREKKLELSPAKITPKPGLLFSPSKWTSPNQYSSSEQSVMLIISKGLMHPSDTSVHR